MARTRTSPALPVPSFEPDDPFFRTLNRVKGEGRRRLLFGLAMAGTPLDALPAVLFRENLTACEHAAFETAGALELDGELLPDLHAGEVEAVRVHWSLPGDDRTLSLRARPLDDGAAWRLVDDGGRSYLLPRSHTPWPPTVRDVVRLLDEVHSATLPHDAGLFRSAWKRARRLGQEREKASRAVCTSAIFLGNGLHRGILELVDAMFEAFWNGTAFEGDAGGSAAPEEVVQ